MSWQPWSGHSVHRNFYYPTPPSFPLNFSCKYCRNSLPISQKTEILPTYSWSLLRKRKAAPDVWKLALYCQLDLGVTKSWSDTHNQGFAVVLLHLNNFTGHEPQSRPSVTRLDQDNSKTTLYSDLNTHKHEHCSCHKMSKHLSVLFHSKCCFFTNCSV